MIAAAWATAPHVEAAPITWDGGGADNNWSTPNNWSTNTVPLAGDTAIFNGTSTKSATIDVNVPILGISINAGYDVTGPGTGTVTQAPGRTLTVGASAFSQSAGIFVGGDSAISITGSLTVNAGAAFTSTTGTLTVTGAVTLAAGVFTHNNGSAVFSTSSVTLNLGGAATFNNVQFLSGTKTITAANTMTVLGQLNLTGGVVNTGTLAAQGNIDVATGFTGGSTTLLINGTGNQLWNGAATGATDLPLVNINKSSGILTMTGAFRTTRNWTHTATAPGGLVVTGSSVVFAGTLTISGSHTLNNVDIRSGGTIVSIAAGTTLTVAGTTELFSGTLNQVAASGILAAHGNINARIGFTGGGTATLLINGSGDQTFDGDHTSIAGALPNVDIDKSSGILTITDTLRTTRNWTHTATIPGGLVVTGSSVVFAGTLTVSGNHTLNNVEIRSGGTIVSIAAGTTLTVAGTTELFSGTLNQVAASGILAAHGNINARIGFTGGGTATLLINGSGDQTFDGDHTSIAGALPNVDIDKSSGILTITDTLRTTRNWTHTATIPGGLVVTGSSVVFAGTLTVSGNHTLNNVEIRSGGTIVSIAAGTTLTVAGTTELFSGTLNQVAASGILAAHGNINARIGFTGGGTATLLINGSGDQTFDGDHTSIAGALPNVEIDKSSGILTITDTLRTTRNWTVTNEAGLVVTGSTLVFAGGTISGSHTLNNVDIRGTVTIAAGTTLTVAGTTELFSGALNSGILAAQGNINARIGFTGGTATLLINGSGDQTFDGDHTSIAGALPNVEIDKTSGILTITDTLRTGRNWTHTATIPGGLVVTGSTLVFAGGTISGSHTLNNVDIRGTVTIAAGTTLTVAGTTELFSGALNSGILAAQGNINARIGFTGGTATLLINGSGDQTFDGDHTSIAGALPNVEIDKSSGILTITDTLRTGRNWTVTNEAGLVVTGSTLVFAGGTISGSHTLNNVDIRGTVTIAAGTTLTVAGTTELFSGALNQVAASGILAAQGNINARIGFTGSGTATLLINGSGDQTFDGDHTSIAGTLPNVDIDKTSGILTITDTLRTGRNWTVTNEAGLVVTGSTLVFAGNLTVSGNHTLNNVDIRGTVTIAAGTTLTVAGTTELFSGALNSGILAAQGNINARIGFTGAGTATLLINGSGDQTFDGDHTSIAGTLPNVEIDKSSGILTITDTLRTTRNWTVTNEAGLVVTGSTLVFAGGTISGSHTLNNVDIRGTVTIAAGTTLTVAGTTELFSGALNQVAASGILAAQGNINARIGFTGSGTATLLINGSGDQTFDGDHTSIAGTLPNVEIDKTSGILTITDTLRTGRNWTVTNEAGLVVTGSTLVFAGNLTVSGNHALNDVTLRSGTVTVTAGDTLTVGGLLTLTDGNLEGGTIEALGDIDLLGGFDGETGTILIAGMADQTLDGAATSSSGDVANIVIDKPAGTLLLVGTIRLVTSSWTWLDGDVDPGSSLLVFDSDVTISGTHDLFDVLLRGGAHTVTGGTLTATGTLTLDDGTIDGGTLAAAGPISQLITFDGGSGLLQITGSSDHTFTGSATPTVGDLPDVQVNLSGGTLSLAGIIRTTQDWTHLVGDVDPDGSTVVFAGTLSINAGGMAFNDVLVNAGTATMTNNLTVAGDLTVAAGTLGVGSHTVFAAGDVTIIAGLTVTTGTLDMNGTTGQNLGGTAAIGLFNLTINDPVGVTQTTTVAVAGTLDLGGPLSFSGESLSIAHAITGAPDNLAGDATSTLIINGTGSGIVIPSSLTDLLNLTITNPNGAALAGPLTIEGTFTLGGAHLDAGSDVLSIGPAGSVSRTSGHVVGALEKWIPVGLGVAMTFEIGDATTYAPVDLVFGTVGTTGQLTASTTLGEHPSIGTSPIDPAQDVNRWWRLTNGGVDFGTVDVTFTFAPGDVDSGAQTSEFLVATLSGSWAMPPSGANTATTITAYGLTSFSEFAVGEAAGPLPDTSAPLQASETPPLAPLLAFAALTVILASLAARSPRRQLPRSWARVASRLSRFEIGRLPVSPAAKPPSRVPGPRR